MTPEAASKAPAKREWAVNALVLLGTLFIGCIAAELMLRYVIQPRGVMTKELLIRQGITEADQAWERHDDLGWMIKSNTTFRHTSPFGEFDTLIETGDNGIRVPPGRKADAPPAERTILFIGDSVTAAYEVEYDDTFVAKVEKALQANSGKPTRAINAGIRGYSTEQSFKRMKVLFDSGIRADDVVYLFSSNDPFENMNLHFPKRFMSKPGAYLDDAGNLRFRSLDYAVGIYDPEALFVEPGGSIGTLPAIGHALVDTRIATNRFRHQERESIYYRSYLLGVIKSAWDLYTEKMISTDEVTSKYPYIKASYVVNPTGGFYPGIIDISWEPNSYPLRLLQKIVAEMKTDAEKRGARFWLALPLNLSSVASEFFAKIASETGVRLIDPTRMAPTQQRIAACGGTIVWKFDGHYNACGHTAQAAAIMDALTGH